MSKYALNIAEDGRILSATYEEFASKNMPLVDTLPDGELYEYRYVNGRYIHDPLPKPEPEPEPVPVPVPEPTITADDILNTLLGVTE